MAHNDQKLQWEIDAANRELESERLEAVEKYGPLLGEAYHRYIHTVRPDEISEDIEDEVFSLVLSQMLGSSDADRQKAVLVILAMMRRTKEALEKLECSGGAYF